jgi:hypothetical protein
VFFFSSSSFSSSSIFVYYQQQQKNKRNPEKKKKILGPSLPSPKKGVTRAKGPRTPQPLTKWPLFNLLLPLQENKKKSTTVVTSHTHTGSIV